MANNNWNNYTEKTATPVDADEVMVRDSADGKNKKLLFGTFWKWVAKKLNEATISELQTSNKTIVGALNQLNSESLNFFTKTGAYDGKTTTFKLKKLTSQPQEFIITTFFRNGGSASPYDSHMLIHINLDGNIKVLKMYGGTGINVSFDSSENALVLTASRGYMSLIVQSNYNFSIIAS